MSQEPCLRNSVAAVHERAVGGKDDRVPKVRSLDPARVFGDLPTGWRSTVKPAVLVELGDVVDSHVVDRQILRQLPQPISPEVMSAAVDEV